MNTLFVFAGLDYSLSGVQVCVVNAEGLILGNHKVLFLVDMEATGNSLNCSIICHKLFVSPMPSQCREAARVRQPR
jgi:hypothetical protein